MEAVDIEMSRDARPFRQTGQCRRLVDTIFRHVAIGSPLASTDRDHAGVFDADGMVSRKRRGIPGFAGTHQRANSREDAENVAARRLLFQIQRSRLQDELNLLFQGDRLDGGLRNWRVGGSDYGVAMPGYGKHHSPVTRSEEHTSELQP